MEQVRKPIIGNFYKHYKGGLYKVVYVSVEASTEEQLVTYQGEDLRLWTTPVSRFNEHVTSNSCLDTVLRFTLTPKKAFIEKDEKSLDCKMPLQP